MQNKKRMIVIASLVCVLVLVGIGFWISQGNHSKSEVGTKASDSKEVIESRKKKKPIDG